MINICPHCKGIIGKETVCPKCGVNIIDYKEELESKSADTPVDSIMSSNDIGNESNDTVHQYNQSIFATGSSLVKCPECGRDRVSSSAAMCPGCGFAVKDYFDRIRYEQEREAQRAAQEEMIKRRQEESILRKKRRRKKLFGSPAKKAAWIFMGSAFSALVVVLSIFAYKEHKVSDAKESARRYFNSLSAEVNELRDYLNGIDDVFNETSLFTLGKIDHVEDELSDIARYQRLVDYQCEVDNRVVDDLNNYISWKTSYQSWNDYKFFLSYTYFFAETDEESAKQLVKFNSFSSVEEKKKKSLIIDSLKMSSNSSYHVVSGSVKNNTSSTVKFVVVEIHLKDADGITFDTDTTYACGEEGIRPGASAKFECYLDKDSRTESCAAWILRYD